jgi:hypothetical protein
MEHYAGIDVSLELSSVCVMDATGRIVREAKVASEPEALIGWFGGLGIEVARVGLEAGPLSQWLFAAMRRKRGDEARLPARVLNVLCRFGAGSFELTLWSTLVTTRRVAGIAG